MGTLLKASGMGIWEVSAIIRLCESTGERELKRVIGLEGVIE